jgi:hypothetical protein
MGFMNPPPPPPLLFFAPPVDLPAAFFGAAMDLSSYSKQV